MSLTRKFLGSMGIESDKIDQIIESHTEVVDGFKADLEQVKAERDDLKSQAAKVIDLEKEIEDLKAAQPTEDWEAKYNDLNRQFEAAKTEHEQFVAQVDADKANAEKLALYKGLLREIGLDEKRVEKAARLKDLSELTVEEGKLVGHDELVESEKAEWAEFIPQTSVHGASVATPPKTEPTADQPNQRAIEIAKERHEKLYGKSEE